MIKQKRKPILCLDFDGVIHSYTSGWQGPRTIPDEPVAGALEFIVRALVDFDVQIYSSRSRYWGGRRAMRRWLVKEYRKVAVIQQDTPLWLYNVVAENAFADSWDDEVKWAVKRLVRRIGWPRYKPPAMVTLDDRAMQFSGVWPRVSDLVKFKPWYKWGE